MTSIDTRPEINPSGHELTEAQLDLAVHAAAALSEQFGADQNDFTIARIDPFEDTEAAEIPELKEGDEGYDGKPWQESRAARIARFAVVYAGEEELSFDPDEPGSVMVKGEWSFPIKSYPPGVAEGVPSINIPIDL